MRKYTINFFITLILIVMLYILISVLSPFNEDAINELVRAENIKSAEELRVVLGQLFAQGLSFEYINLRNFAIAAGLLGLTIASGFSLLHMIFERLVLLKFYEEPLVSKSIRRGLIVAIGVVGLLILNLIATRWYVLVAFAVVIAVLEIVLTTQLKQRPVIQERYQDDTDLLEGDTDSVAGAIQKTSTAFSKYIGSALKLAYFGSRKSVDQSALSRDEVLPESELMLRSTDENPTDSTKLE